MRFKTLAEPTGIMQKGDEWLSPDGHSPTWRRVWNGTAFVEDLKAAGFPLTELSPTLSAEELAKVGTDDDTDETDDTDDTDEDEQPPTEDHDDEQGVQTEVSDRNGGEQGSGGGSGSEPEQRGKRGKVRKGRKGK